MHFGSHVWSNLIKMISITTIGHTKAGIINTQDKCFYRNITKYMPYIQHKQAIVDLLYTLSNQNKNKIKIIVV